jgi:hypothetical protein
MKWTTKHDRRVNEYAEIIFDDVFENSPNAAIWFHANEEGDAAIYITRDTPDRRRLLIDSLVEALLMDQEMMEDFLTAVALAVHRMNEERGGLSSDDILDR